MTFPLLCILLTMHFPQNSTIISGNPSFTLPDDIAGWTTDDRGRWDAETLCRYINGGTELFLSHGFDAAASRRYAHDDQPEITVDIFRMRRPQDAFAVYSLSREREDGGFGQGAQVGAGLLLFWKHRYFISILASPQTPESSDAVRELARHIDAAIPETGALPDVVTMLPAANRRPASVRHFRHHAWQNVYGFFSGENILGIGDEAPAGGARIIEAKRREFFGEERPVNPPPKHIELAQTRHGLGTADPARIDLVTLGWKKDMLIEKL